MLKEVQREFTVPVEHANPNRLGVIALVKQVGVDVWWFYDATDAEVWTNEYSSEELARKEYQTELQRLQNTPKRSTTRHTALSTVKIVAWNEMFGGEY